MELPITLDNCPVSLNGDLDPSRSITVIPQTHDCVVNEKQLFDYKAQRIDFLSWLLNLGKDPKGGKGYAEYTVYSTAYRTARFDKWLWEERSKYVYPPSQGDAKDYLKYLAYSDKG